VQDIGVLFKICLTLAAILLISIGLYSSGLQLHPASLSDMRPPLDDLLARMMAYRQWQNSSLREYQAHRRFYASNPRFSKDSTLEVQTVFHWPYSLQSTVLRQDGSDFIRERVFDKIIEAESDMVVSDQGDIIPKNYDFSFVGKEDCQGRPCWRLAIKPKRKDKFLIDGDIWLDSADYAVTHVHGVPSKHVSVWVSRVEIDRRLSRIEGVWLTNKIESSSNIHLVGDVVLQIEYVYDSVKVASALTAKDLTTHRD
jgi:hypothetical protein